MGCSIAPGAPRVRVAERRRVRPLFPVGGQRQRPTRGSSEEHGCGRHSKRVRDTSCVLGRTCADLHATCPTAPRLSLVPLSLRHCRTGTHALCRSMV